jgi:Ni,Fe-hydrogenase III component G
MTLKIGNGTAVPLEAVPRLELEAFRGAVIDAPARGCRVSALFGARRGERLALYLVLADDDAGVLECAATELEGDGFPSMTPECPEVHLFEREIAEDWGVTPEGHP